MPNPAFEIITHRGKSRIKVMFETNVSWNLRMMHVPGAKWSKMLKSWHIPDTPENRKRCGLPGGESVTRTITSGIDRRAAIRTQVGQTEAVFSRQHSRPICPV